LTKFPGSVTELPGYLVVLDSGRVVVELRGIAEWLGNLPLP